MVLESMYESLFCSFQEGVNVGGRRLDKLKVRLTKHQPQLVINQSCYKKSCDHHNGETSVLVFTFQYLLSHLSMCYIQI